jgi:integrase
VVFKRQGRPGYSFQAKTRHGWEQLTVSAKSAKLANAVVAMWNDHLAEKRAWDILDPILQAGRDKGKSLLALYDLWNDCARDIEEIRRRLKDVDIEPLVKEYMGIYKKRDVEPTTVEYVEKHLRFLLPKDVPCPASSINADMLTKRLHEYPGGSTTLDKVHSSWNGYLGYLTLPKRIYSANPMNHVERPGTSKGTIQFYELDVVQKIVDAQPDMERKALFALMYGTGIESSIVVGKSQGKKPIAPLTRAHFDEATHEVRAGGTKTYTRDRIVRVADWAWPHVERYIKTMLPTTPLWQRDRSTLSHWHLQTIRAMNKPEAMYPEYPLYNARHHWAVRQLRAGSPIHLVQTQLGHANPTETLNTYGRFIPNSEDRARWEKAATKLEKKRSAK